MKEPFDEPTMRGHSGSRYYEGRKIFGGRFLLQKQIGRGGMGEVWLAQDGELSQSRAIKFLPPEIASDQRAVGQLRREARAGMELAHPRIVRTNDFYSEDEDAAVVMEYVEGRTMSAVQAETEEGFLEVAAIKGWVEDVVQALRYAHGEMGRVHRDIKPQNVIVETGTGRAKLMDFGISRRISDTHTMLTGADAAGTLAYSSPQQVLGESPSAADDIYSLGATIYDLLTGTPPFFRGDLQTQVAKSTAPPMMERRKELLQAGMVGGMGEEIPKAWEALVAACLGKVLESRPQSMDEFVALMEGTGKARAAAVPPTLPPEAKVVTQAEPEVASKPERKSAPAPIPQELATPAPAKQPVCEPAGPRKSHTGLKVLVGLLVLMAAGLGGYLVIAIVLDEGKEPDPVVITPPVDRPKKVDSPVSKPWKNPVKEPVVKTPPRQEPEKATRESVPKPNPDLPENWSREKLAAVVGGFSKRFVEAGNTGAAVGQDAFFADRINYFGTWKSRDEARSDLLNHQRSWPTRKYVAEDPDVTVAADHESAEVRMWIRHESGNFEKVTSARILSYLKWNLSDLKNVKLTQQLELAREDSWTRFKDGSPWVGGKTDRELKESAAKMALDYYRAGSSGSRLSQIDMMASRVDYFGDTMGKSEIAANLRDYHAKWPVRKYVPETPVPVTLDADRRGATVHVWFKMTLSSATKEASGRMQGRLHIRWDASGKAGIVSASTSSKGTMSTREK